MSLNYTKKTIDNFLHPQNIGQVKDPDAIASVGNMVCGDQLEFSLKVKNGRIADVAFLSFGCASNIATASVLTEKVKGMTLEEAKKYPWQKIVDELGGLPNQKIHCSVLAVEGLKKVIAEYEGKHPVAGKIPGKKPAAKKAKSAKLKRK